MSRWTPSLIQMMKRNPDLLKSRNPQQKNRSQKMMDLEKSPPLPTSPETEMNLKSLKETMQENPSPEEPTGMKHLE